MNLTDSSGDDDFIGTSWTGRHLDIFSKELARKPSHMTESWTPAAVYITDILTPVHSVADPLKLG